MKWTEATTTSTGNVDDLDFADADLLRCDNASLMTLRGLKAGVQGQRLTIVSVGAGQVDISHQDTGDAVAANRLICFATSGKTSLAAGTGAATVQYDAVTARWRLVQHEQGDYIAAAFSAGDYTGTGSMTWTVDSGDCSCRYYLRGRQLEVALTVATSSVGGTPSLTLQRVVPGGYSVGSAGSNGIINRVLDNGTSKVGYFTANSSDSLLKFQNNVSATNWSASTNNTYVLFNGFVAVS